MSRSNKGPGKPIEQREGMSIAEKARHMDHRRGTVVLQGREPMFDREYRLCRRIRDGNIFQLRRWIPRLQRSAATLARNWQTFIAKGHAPALFPGLGLLRDIDATLTFAKQHLYERTKRSNPVGTGGIPRRLV